MRLKGLEIQGFKSFADKTYIGFGEGITAIVGPNGSGKSNISDAIRWVMGEQSAKSLRGGNMQDVIFAGTQKRKPLGYAEVSLIIDNADKQLDIDYDEVIITRRVYRSGESEFYINKSSVRLKDVHELFMDTGVGRDGYSIIGQGKISEIVSSKPEDRRQMFEEASGISKFRHRKEEAERKLLRTQENILRVNDIITELENQVEPLRVQSEKAVKFLNYREELKTVDVNVSLYNIERYKKALSEADEACLAISASVAEVSSETEEVEKLISAMFENITRDEEQTEKNRELYKQKNESLSEFQKDIGILNSRIEYNKENIKRIFGEINELAAKADELELSLSGNNEGFNGLVERERELESSIQQLEQQLDGLDRQSESKGGSLEEINVKILEHANKIADLKNKISGITALSGSLEERISSIGSEALASEKNIQQLKGDIKNNKQQLQEKSEALKAKTGNMAEKTALRDKLAGDCNELTAQKQSAENDLKIADSRKKLLIDLEQSFDNYSNSVKSVMKAYKNSELKDVNIHGTVAQTMEADKKYAVAIEAALGGAVQYIVTEKESDAKKSIEYLKRTKQGRATFLPVSAAKARTLEEKGVDTMPGYIGAACDLVKYDERFTGVVKGLLGNIAVADNIDNAIAIAKKYKYKFRIVTLDGELLAPGGSISGGSTGKRSGIFVRANEIAELDIKIKDIKKSIDALGRQHEKYLKEAESVTAEINILRQSITEESGQVIKLESEARHLTALLDNEIKVRETYFDEKAGIENQLKAMAGERTEYVKQLDNAQAETALLEKQADIERQSICRTGDKKKAISDEITRMKMQLNDIRKDIDIYNEKTALAESRKQEIEKNIQQKKHNAKELEDANDDLADDIEFKKQQTEDIREEMQQINSVITETDSGRKKAQEDIQKKQGLLKELRDKQIALQTEQGKCENKKIKSESELEFIINRLWEDYELTVTEAEKCKDDSISYTASVKKINELKTKIKNLGNINVDSIEEYRVVKERYDFLTSQRDDLVTAQKNLKTVITEMVNIMKEQFAEKFVVINRHFGQVFSELFGGGKAQLKLTEPEDVLAGGVEIDVQPPGKAIKSIMQLSGGEQAFVSIALLFAMLEVRPSPYCVLDEIEAALDDVNVYRFAEYLKRFSEKSQFVVVTHRRGTMENANVLYGVTMQEQGVTKLLSMNIDDVVENA